jgi:hypothetical protein
MIVQHRGVIVSEAAQQVQGSRTGSAGDGGCESHHAAARRQISLKVVAVSCHCLSRPKRSIGIVTMPVHSLSIRERACGGIDKCRLLSERATIRAHKKMNQRAVHRGSTFVRQTH